MQNRPCVVRRSVYPILDKADAPDTIDIVLLDRPRPAPTRPRSVRSAAAIGNAIFDATGTRQQRRLSCFSAAPYEYTQSRIK